MMRWKISASQALILLCMYAFISINNSLKTFLVFFFFLFFISRFKHKTGHYTQVVWAETDEVGCGFNYYKVNIVIIDFRIQISDILRKTIFTGLCSSATMLLVGICRDLWCTKLVRLVQSVEMDYHAMQDCVLKINGNWNLLIGK